MMNVTSDLRLRRFILAGTMLAVCLSLTFSPTGGSVASPGPICNNPASIRQGGFSLAGDFCVDVVEPSQNNTATLTAQAFYGGSWHDLGTDANFYANVGNAVGTNCGSFEALSNSLVTGSPIDYRVVGRDGAGGALCSPICIPTCSQDNVGAGFAVNIDCPQFGTIWLIQIGRAHV